MLVRVLGPLEVVPTSSAVGRHTGLPALGGPRQRCVLAALAMHAGHVLSSQTLLDAVWPDVAPPTARGTLQAYISRLRAVVGHDRLRGVNGGYCLSLGRGELDAWRLEDALAEAESRSPGPDADLRLSDALELWRGRPLGELAAHLFAGAYVAELDDLHARAVCVLAGHLLDRDDPDAAVHHLHRATTEHPFDSKIVALLIAAHQRQGRPDAAIAAYRTYRDRLRHDLGLAPSAELIALAEQVAAEQQGAVQSPRPRTGSGLEVDLPDPEHGLVGRERELTVLLRTVGQRRLVTLVGPPGVGKSRLALEVGMRHRHAGRDDLRVLLEGVRGPGQLMDALLAACRVTATPGVPHQRSLIRSLRARGSVLLILDAAERLTTQAIEVLGQVHADVPSCTMLVTSLAECGLPDERVVRVDPLTVPAADGPLLDSEAGTLLVARARLLQPGIAVTPDNEAALSRIVRHLDGLPLAIELAAAQLVLLGPAELERRLSERFDVLLAPGQSGRHVSLRATMAAAMDNLDTALRAVIERLGVAAGALPLELAGRLVQDVSLPGWPSPRAAILALARRSLVIVDERGVAMLESIREYCVERLRITGTWDVAVMRHADVLIEQMQRWQAHGHSGELGRAAEAVERLSTEVSVAIDRADPVASRRLAALVAPWWYRAGRLHELAEMADQVWECREGPAGRPDVDTIRLIGYGTLAAASSGVAWDRASERASWAVEAARQTGNETLAVEARLLRGSLRTVIEDWSGAAEDLGHVIDSSQAESWMKEWARLRRLRVDWVEPRRTAFPVQVSQDQQAASRLQASASTMTAMNVLVVGATGLVGGLVAVELAKRGERVRALSRPGAQTADLERHGVQLVPGDLADALSLRRALADVDAVVATANSARPRLEHDSVRSIEIDGYASLISGATDAGVARFVYLSALIADEQSPMEFLRAKAGVERRLADSGMPFTVVAPGPFDEVWPAAVVVAPAMAGQPVTLVRPGTHRHSFVSVNDVAAYCTAAIYRPDTVGERVVVGGPQNLSWQDVVAVYERASGQTVDVRYVDPGQELPGAPPVFTAMMAGFESGHVEVDMRATSERFGITPTPWEAVATAMVRG